MPVDVRISEVTSKVSASDPELLNDPKFVRRIVMMVKEELARDAEVERHRLKDRGGPGGRR